MMDLMRSALLPNLLPNPQNGDLHIQVSATNVMLGAQLQGLSVMPPGGFCGAERPQPS
jgi:hypothetical protein